jgi:hypothetical protein
MIMSFAWAFPAFSWLSFHRSIAWHGVHGFEPMYKYYITYKGLRGLMDGRGRLVKEIGF